MVRLSDLRTEFLEVGTTGTIIPNDRLGEGQVRRIYRLKAQQRGATLNTFTLYKRLGATLGATLDSIRFGVLDEAYDSGPVYENSVPVYEDLERATIDAVFASVDVSSVELLLQFADEYRG